MSTMQRKSCINCSTDLDLNLLEEVTASDNKNLNQFAFYTLHCSSRVRSPSSGPVTVEEIPVHRALSTIFKCDNLFLEELSDGKKNSKSVCQTETTVDSPLCFVCYLVLSDLYKIYTEFSQLRHTNSFLSSKLRLRQELNCQKNQGVSNPVSVSAEEPGPVEGIVKLETYSELEPEVDIGSNIDSEGVNSVSKIENLGTENEDFVDESNYADAAASASVDLDLDVDPLANPWKCEGVDRDDEHDTYWSHEEALSDDGNDTNTPEDENVKVLPIPTELLETASMPEAPPNLPVKKVKKVLRKSVRRKRRRFGDSPDDDEDDSLEMTNKKPVTRGRRKTKNPPTLASIASSTSSESELESEEEDSKLPSSDVALGRTETLAHYSKPVILTVIRKGKKEVLYGCPANTCRGKVQSTSKSVILKHIRRIHRAVRLKCPYVSCSTRCWSKYLLDEHIQRIHLSGGASPSSTGRNETIAVAVNAMKLLCPSRTGSTSGKMDPG